MEVTFGVGKGRITRWNKNVTILVLMEVTFGEQNRRKPLKTPEFPRIPVFCHSPAWGRLCVSGEQIGISWQKTPPFQISEPLRPKGLGAFWAVFREKRARGSAFYCDFTRFLPGLQGAGEKTPPGGALRRASFLPAGGRDSAVPGPLHPGPAAAGGAAVVPV